MVKFGCELHILDFQNSNVVFSWGEGEVFETNVVANGAGIFIFCILKSQQETHHGISEIKLPFISFKQADVELDLQTRVSCSKFSTRVHSRKKPTMHKNSYKWTF